MHVRVCRKDDIFRQRRLNHSGVGGRKIAFRRVYPARAYTTLVVLVARIKTLRQKNLVIVTFFLLDFERFSMERFYIEDFKRVPFRQFLSYKNVPYIKMG